jgi:hypothetical protein
VEALLSLALAALAIALAVLWRRERGELLRALHAAWEERDRGAKERAGGEAETKWFGAAAQATSDMILVVGKDSANAVLKRGCGALFGPTRLSTLLLYTRSVEAERLASDALLSSHPDGLERSSGWREIAGARPGHG